MSYDPIKAIFNRAAFSALSPTSEVTIYTADNPWSYVHKVHICNTTGSAATISIRVYDAAGTTLYEWVAGKSVAANDVLDLVMDFQLEEGDEIRAQQSAIDTFDIAVVVAEGRGRTG